MDDFARCLQVSICDGIKRPSEDRDKRPLWRKCKKFKGSGEAEKKCNIGPSKHHTLVCSQAMNVCNRKCSFWGFCPPKWACRQFALLSGIATATSNARDPMLPHNVHLAVAVNRFAGGVGIRCDCASQHPIPM
jgi:hypothetical protein